MQTLTGTVESLEGDRAIIKLDDGSTRTLNVPEQISVEKGMGVKIVDTGDGAPIVAWGV